MDGFDLAAERRRSGVTQAELAGNVGINQATLVDIERGRVPMDADLEARLLKGISTVAKAKKASKKAVSAA